MVPLYPLYALFFTASGLSAAQVSALFAIWSAVGFAAEVPAGVLADRFSRRGALVVAGILQAAGYAVWMTSPHFGGFAAGFALWGVAGALVSGALEALLFEGLEAVGAGEHYGRLAGRVAAAGLVAQVPAALAATALYYAGGYRLVGWVSVASCAAAAGLASALPEARSQPAPDSGPGLGYWKTLRAGIAQAVKAPAVRTAVIAVALLTSLDALDEYFPLLAHDWRVPTGLIPVAVLGIPLAGASGAALGGRAATRMDAKSIAGVLALGALLLGAAGLLHQPGGLAAVAGFYGLYRLVAVIGDVRLQEQITGPARATVTSISALGTEVAVIGVYAAWAIGGVLLVAGAIAGIALTLPSLLRSVTR